MAFTVLLGMSYLYNSKNESLYPKLTEHSFLLNGQEVHPTKTQETSMKFSYNNYDEIIFKCTSQNFVKWIFEDSPMFNTKVLHINITAERIVTNNTITFVSFLKLKLATNYFYTGSIGCRNILSDKNVTWLHMKGDENNRKTTFQFQLGSKIGNSPNLPGDNVNCRTFLFVDDKNDQIGCKYRKLHVPVGQEEMVFAKMRYVSNIDEIDALIRTDKLCDTTIVRKELRCDYNDFCLSSKNIHSAAVVVCGVGSNTLSVPIFRSNSTLSFRVNEYRKESNELRIGSVNVSLHVGPSYNFTCMGTFLRFTKGFFWTMQERKIYKLGHGIDIVNENNQVVSRKSITFPTLGNFTVHCLAPWWDSTKWSHHTLNVVVSEYLSTTTTPLMEETVSDGIDDYQSNNNQTLSAETDMSLFSGSHATIIIAAISSIIVITLLCAGLLLIALRKINSQSRQLQLLTEEEIYDFEKGNPKADTALFLPYNMEFEIPVEKLQIGNVILGDGNFGQVQKGRYGSVHVAVKTVKKSSDSLYFKALLSELKIMSYVGRHINIVHLVGACTKDLRKGNVYLVYEYCANGNMQQFLRKSRRSFDMVNELKTRTLEVPRAKRKTRYGLSWMENANKDTPSELECLTMKDLVLWSQQIASAMDYVSSKNIIHGDLAARNVLITDNKHAKLADFGLSKQLFDYSIYVHKQHCPLPLKWMAPESLRDMEFSIQSDVWSFGVTLWEIYALGELPYPGIDWNYEAWKILRDGFRMERPKHASPAMFKTIAECWHVEPNKRPTFKFLTDHFGEELHQLLLISDKVFDRLWM